MGKQENRSAKLRKSKNFQKAILGVISTAGVLGIAAVAPNVLTLLKLGANDRTFKYRTNRAFERLVQKGLIKIDGGSARLTTEGQKVLEMDGYRETFRSRKGRKWDGEWRVVAFDIPERRRRTRDQLRSLMQEAGFVQLQGSVWIFPYECEELLVLMKTELRVGKEVLYMVVSALEGDEHLRRHFGLRSQ